MRIYGDILPFIPDVGNLHHPFLQINGKKSSKFIYTVCKYTGPSLRTDPNFSAAWVFSLQSESLPWTFLLLQDCFWKMLSACVLMFLKISVCLHLQKRSPLGADFSVGSWVDFSTLVHFVKVCSGFHNFW